MKEKDLPLPVRNAAKHLRETNEHYVSIKVIKGKFYAFAMTTKRDAATKKNRTITSYLGSIKPDGTFQPAKHRGQKDEVITVVPAEILLHQEKVDPKEATILRALSMNSRISLSHLGKMLNLDRTSTDYWFKKVEQKYDLQYIAEIDVEKLGFLEYMVLVKFDDKIPSINELKDAISKQGRVQLAALTQGEYDLLMIICVEKSREARSDIYELREAIAPTYNSKWYLDVLYSTYSFVPLREQFFDILKKKTNKDSGNEIDGKKELLKREYSVLRELNENANIDFTEIDKKYGFDNGRSQYTYYKLKEGGTLRRTTITMRKTDVKYNAILDLEMVNHINFASTREKLIREIINDNHYPMNKYLLVGDVEMPEGVLFILPAHKESDLKMTQDWLNNNLSGIKLKTLIITEVIVGTFCYRLFDNEHTHQREILSYKYGLKPAEKKNYDNFKS